MCRSTQTMNYTHQTIAVTKFCNVPCLQMVFNTAHGWVGFSRMTQLHRLLDVINQVLVQKLNHFFKRAVLIDALLEHWTFEKLNSSFGLLLPIPFMNLLPRRTWLRLRYGRFIRRMLHRTPAWQDHQNWINIGRGPTVYENEGFAVDRNFARDCWFIHEALDGHPIQFSYHEDVSIPLSNSQVTGERYQFSIRIRPIPEPPSEEEQQEEQQELRVIDELEDESDLDTSDTELESEDAQQY